MNPFDYVTATSPEAAVQEIGVNNEYSSVAKGMSKFVAGGTNLLDLMKENLLRPNKLVDINRLPFNTIEPSDSGGLLLGALVTNADTAYNKMLRSNFPLLSAAILAGASPQLRNMATNGGNLLQRTRCYYYYDSTVPCNKREPGTGCSAKNGLARLHAIFGASEWCIATHPSDMCVALAALNATVHVRSQHGARTIPFTDFHRLPGDRPDIDTHLAADELITQIELPNAAQFAAHSAYLKIRDRASYAFALVSVAAALDLDEQGRIREARIALGGVAHKPWRNLGAEDLLKGQMPSSALFEQAAAMILSEAQVHGHPESNNAFKIPMAQRAVVRALETALKGTVTNTSEVDQNGEYDTHSDTHPDADQNAQPNVGDQA